MSAWTRQVAICLLGGLLNLSVIVGSYAGPTRDLLVDQYGHPVPAARLVGHWLLVYFGYTECPDICPAALTRMNSVLSLLGSSGPEILPVFITLDPGNDTPERLRIFSARFNSKLVALTGSPAAITEAASRFGIVWNRGAGSHGIDHEALWYVVSPDSEIVQVVHPVQQPDEIAQSILAAIERR